MEENQKPASPPWGWNAKFIVSLTIVGIVGFLIIKFQNFLGPLLIAGLAPGEPVGRILAALGLTDKVAVIRGDRVYVFPDFRIEIPAEYGGPLWRREALKRIFPDEQRSLDRYYRFHNRVTRILDLATQAEWAPRGTAILRRAELLARGVKGILISPIDAVGVNAAYTVIKNLTLAADYKYYSYDKTGDSSYFGGKAIHPVLGLPGGVSKGLKPEDLPGFARAMASVPEEIVVRFEAAPGH